MASVNKAIILGNSTRDVEVRYSPSGAAVANLSIATNRKWKDKTSGEMTEETEFHRVTLYNRLAEVARDYLPKGKPVYIEGRIQTRKWQDKEGKDRWTTEIIGESLQLLGGREDGQSAPAKPQRQASADEYRNKQARPAPNFDDEMDDSIPF